MLQALKNRRDSDPGDRPKSVRFGKASAAEDIPRRPSESGELPEHATPSFSSTASSGADFENAQASPWKFLDAFRTRISVI